MEYTFAIGKFRYGKRIRKNVSWARMLIVLLSVIVIGFLAEIWSADQEKFLFLFFLIFLETVIIVWIDVKLLMKYIVSGFVKFQDDQLYLSLSDQSIKFRDIKYIDLKYDPIDNELIRGPNAIIFLFLRNGENLRIELVRWHTEGKFRIFSKYRRDLATIIRKTGIPYSLNKFTRGAYYSPKYPI